MKRFLMISIFFCLAISVAFAHYGAKYEPPDGKTLHGVGWQAAAQNAYSEMLPDSMQPLLHQAMVPLPGYMRRGGMTVAGLLRAMAPDNFNAETQYAEISVQFELNEQRGDQTIAMMVDTIFANSDTYDSYMDTMAIALRRHDKPIFLRIGLEMNGDWNGYTPWVFPLAFRKLVLGLREREVDNFATVWCYEPDADDDFADSTRAGWKWYPGDDVVDWFGLDPFDVDHFDPDLPDSVEGRNGWDISKKGKTEKFLRFAREREKPVYLNELSARHVWITPFRPGVDSTHGSVDWEFWFEPFFEFLDDHPNIKAFNYINLDWSQIERWEHWGDARLQINEYIRNHWIGALSDERYIHSGYDISQVVSVPKVIKPMPNAFNLAVYPNPFNSSTKISFSLNSSTHATITVYDLFGKPVDVLFNGRAEAGVNQMTWNAGEYPSGVYIVRMASSYGKSASKMLLLR